MGGWGEDKKRRRTCVVLRLLGYGFGEILCSFLALVGKMQCVVNGDIGFTGAIVPGEKSNAFVFHNYSCFLMILPLVVFGKDSRNSTILGYL